MVGLEYGEVVKNGKFLHIPYRCKIEQPDTRQSNGITNSETEMCIRCYEYLEVDCLEDEKSNILRVRSSDRAFSRNYQSSKVRPCRRRQGLFK